MAIRPMKNKRFSFILQFFFWIMLFILVFEVIIRNFIIMYPPQQDVLGLGTVPLENSIVVWGIEGYGVTRFLSNGEIFTPYETGVSVVVLGDSFTEGLQVADDQKYVSVAEELLHERNLKIDMHNLGTSGRSIADYVYIAPFIMKTYSPEVVIIQVSITDFNESFSKTKNNYFRLNDDSLELIHNEAKYSIPQNVRNLIRSSGLIALIRYKIQPVIETQIKKILIPNNEETTQNPPEKDERVNNIRLQVSALENAYPNTKIIFLIIPNVPMFTDGDAIWVNQNDVFLVDTLNQFSSAPIIYPLDYFHELYIDANVFPRGFFNTLPNYGHLNSDGNYVIGEAIADVLGDVFR